MSTCNWLDLETLGSQPIMPKISVTKPLPSAKEIFRESENPTIHRMISHFHTPEVYEWKLGIGWVLSDTTPNHMPLKHRCLI